MHRFILKIIYFSYFGLSIYGCNNQLDIKGAKQATTALKIRSYIWDFDNSGDYTFPSNYVETSSGSANLKTVDTIHSGTDFNNGTYSGVFLDDNNNLTLRDRPTLQETHVSTILPARSTNLIGFWRFEDNWNDESPFSHNGTSFGGSAYSTDSKLGQKSGDLPSDGDYILAADTPVLRPSHVTASVWFKASTQGNFKYIISKNFDANAGSFSLSTNNTGGLYFYIHTSTGNAFSPNAGTTYWDNEWHHAVGTYDEVNLRLYVDGVEIGSGTPETRAISYSSNSLSIGSFYDDAATADLYYNGKLDDFALWNTALNADEIKGLYDIQNSSYIELSSSWTPKHSSLVGYWKMDGNWKDSSGNANHFTTIQSDPIFSSTSKIGSASSYFDTNDGVKITAATGLATTTMTLSAWVKIDDLDSTIWRTIVEYGRNTTNWYGLWTDPTSNVFHFRWGNPGTSNFITQIIENRWYHVAATFDPLTDSAKLYLDGKLDRTLFATQTPVATLSNLSLGMNDSLAENFQNGHIDDVAIFNSALTEADIKTIYERQKQKYAGHYESPVMDFGTSVPWDNLIPVTTLPFYKELPMINEETSSYSLLRNSSGILSDSELSVGLVALWDFNETVFDSVTGGFDFEDKSGNGNHASESGGIKLTSEGKFLGAVEFDGTDDYILPTMSGSVTDNFTVSTWVRPYGFNQSTIIGSRGPAFFSFDMKIQTPTLLHANIGDGSAWLDMAADATYTFNEDNWYHIVYAVTTTGHKIYVNGVNLSDVLFAGPSTPLLFDATHLLVLGDYRSGGGDFFKGLMDEVAIWSRALDSAEVRQLYRRGANRIKYQVKSCVDSSCACESYNTSPLGSSTDCDGDGNLNDVDFDDSYKANWLGKNGETGETFSELQNCTTIDGVTSGDCTGLVKETPPNFLFSNFPSSARPSNKRYFQYRVLMESDDNTACSGPACMPELISLEIGSPGSYYAGTPEIIPASSSVVFKNINSMSFTESGTCTITYQISKDGVNYNYYDGTSWVQALDASESSTSALISTNITDFASEVGTGTLHWKAFLTSDTFEDCRLDNISITVTP